MGWKEYLEAKAKDPLRHEVIILKSTYWEWFECSCGAQGEMRERGTGNGQIEWADHFRQEMGKIDVDSPLDI